MRTLCVLLLFAGTLAWAGQDAVPLKVDQALRDRVTKFYQAHVDGKYRQAEQYIAEESKDIYYAVTKPHYLKFAIKKIAYSDNFTRAAVTALCDQEVRNPAIGSMSMTFPVESVWKVENGLWVFYIDPDAARTPFGKVRRAQGGQAPAPPPAGADKRPNPEELLKTVTSAVRADRTEVRLNSPDATEGILLTNTMPGAVTLSVKLPSEKPGFSAWLEREKLGPKESGRVLFRLTEQPAGPRPPVVVTVSVQPTGQTIPVRVTVVSPAK